MESNDIILPSRPKRVEHQESLFDIDPDWRSEWWGMPELTMDDARPTRTIHIHFMTDEDVRNFASTIGVRVTNETNALWFPPQERLNKKYIYDGQREDSKYPVCIPSKGRADCQLTGHVLDNLGISYRFFVEETEFEEYKKHVGEQRVVKMPFHDLGQGSVPARNFIWDWAVANGYKRHWTLDDNIKGFVRLNNNRRIPVRGGMFFRAMEDFVDRYENVVMAGPHNRSFDGGDRSPTKRPFRTNSRVYSCILLDTTKPHRWRGKYNEDTDLSIRFLKDGFCTMLFCSLLMDKDTTVGAKNSKAMKGGNTDNVYNTGDHRLAFAQSLKDQHPDCVEVVWKFNRWHHQVDYSQFKNNKLIRKQGIVPTASNNEYGMKLVRAKEGKP